MLPVGIAGAMRCILIGRMRARADDTATVFKGVPHLMDPSRTIVAWFTDPPGVYVQVVRRTVFSVPLAEWLAGPLTAGLNKRFPGDQPLVLVLDLSQMEGRDPGARPIVVEATRAFAARTQRAVLVPPANASRVYVASLQAATSLARLVGVSVTVESLADAVRSLAMASPNP